MNRIPHHKPAPRLPTESTRGETSLFAQPLLGKLSPSDPTKKNSSTAYQQQLNWLAEISTKGERELRNARTQLLADLNLSGIAHQLLSELPMGLIRMVDIARAMAAASNYLLLDEPAAGLSQAEQNVLVDQVRHLASRGVGVLLVEHNFRLVRSVADRVVVLNRGEVLLRGTAEEVSQSPEFVNAYLGTGVF